MQRKLFLFLFITSLVPALMLGATGKIRGKVTDAGTGEPLVGANVVVVGTSMGAATNVSGEYTILNVQAGTYTLKTSYIGYQAITLSNVRVNADLTSEANFQLPAEGVTVATVEITAERPLVNKSATNAVRIVDPEFFSKIPARGLNTAIAVQPGVVFQGGNVYIRGGRLDETGYLIDGVGVNNVLFGGRAVNISAEAVEQVQVMAGGYNAEYGGANAGLVVTQLRSGNPDAWKATLLAETDNYTKQGKQSLGGYSYGYSDFTGTFGGPLLGRKLRFFGSIENTFYRDPSIRVWDGFNFSGANAFVAAPNATPAHGSGVSDTVNLIYPSGNFFGGSNNRYYYAGTLLYDMGEMQLRAAGSFSQLNSQDVADIANMLNASRMTAHKVQDGFGNVKFSHVITPTMFYEVNLNYYNNTQIDQDPNFGSNLFLYGDSAANAALGYHLAGTSTNYSSYSFWGGGSSGLNINQPGTQIAGFQRIKQLSYGGRVDFTNQLKQHEIKVGGEYNRYTIRRFNPGGELQWAKGLQLYPNDRYQLGKYLRQQGNGADNYGYDVFGNEISGDQIDPASGDITDFGPRHPVFGAAYVQDKIEFSDIVMNLGLRFDYINPDSWDVKNPNFLNLNDTLKVISASNFVKTPTTKQISPRIGFSFPVSDRTVFHAQFGKFIQQSELRDSYLGMANAYGLIKGGFFVQQTFGYGLRPERTTQYEMGFAQQISDVASFDITAFYKDITDQITYVNVAPAAGAPQGNYAQLINGDFATSKGLEMKFTLRRTNRITAQVNYTFADARSTGSNPTVLAGAAVTGSSPILPKYVFPSDFNQAHRGSILFDYRFGKDDGGPILEQLGLNVLAQFNSGHNFTRLRQDDNNTTDPRNRIPIEEIGASTTPWFFQLDARLDKTVRLGPLDANFYIYVINLLGTENAVNVFPRTGDPKDDGWLSTDSGHAQVVAQGPQYATFYNALFLGNNANNFGPPRQIRFGVKLDY